MSTPKKQGKKPSFNVFIRDANKAIHRVGAVFSHNSGEGFNVKIGQMIYEMYPNKTKPKEGDSA